MSDHQPTPPAQISATSNSVRTSRRPLPERVPAAVLSLLVAAIAAAVYLPAIGGAWIFDDFSATLAKQRIVAVSSGKEPLLHAAEGSQRPLTDLSFAVVLRAQGHEMGGRPSTTPHLVINIAIHAGAAAVLFLTVRLIVCGPQKEAPGRTQGGGAVGTTAPRAPAATIALAVSLLWAVHPLTTQAVAYIVQRSEALMALLALVATYTFIVFARAERKPETENRLVTPLAWLVTACVAAALSIFAKPVMVGLPVILLLADRAATGDTFVRVTRRRWWAHGLTVLSVIVALVLSGTAGNVFERETENTRTVGFAYAAKPNGHSPIEHLITQGEVLTHYLRLTAWPDPLSLDYGWRAVDLETGLPGAGVVVACIFVGLLFLGSLALALVRPATGVAAVAFFVILGPTSSIVPMRDPAFEHRMYLPTAAVIGVAVAAAFTLLKRRYGDRGLRIPAAAVLVPVLLIGGALAARTVARLGDYRSAETMMAANVDAQPNKARPLMNLGLAKMDRINRAALDADEPLDPDDPRSSKRSTSCAALSRSRRSRRHAATDSPSGSSCSGAGASARPPTNENGPCWSRHATNSHGSSMRPTRSPSTGSTSRPPSDRSDRTTALSPPSKTLISTPEA